MQLYMHVAISHIIGKVAGSVVVSAQTKFWDVEIFVKISHFFQKLIA